MLFKIDRLINYNRAPFFKIFYSEYKLSSHYDLQFIINKCELIKIFDISAFLKLKQTNNVNIF